MCNPIARIMQRPCAQGMYETIRPGAVHMRKLSGNLSKQKKVGEKGNFALKTFFAQCTKRGSGLSEAPTVKGDQLPGGNAPYFPL